MSPPRLTHPSTTRLCDSRLHLHTYPSSCCFYCISQHIEHTSAHISLHWNSYFGAVTFVNDCLSKHKACSPRRCLFCNFYHPHELRYSPQPRLSLASDSRFAHQPCFLTTFYYTNRRHSLDRSTYSYNNISTTLSGHSWIQQSISDRLFND